MGAGVGNIIMPTSYLETLMLKGGAQGAREGRDPASSTYSQTTSHQLLQMKVTVKTRHLPSTVLVLPSIQVETLGPRDCHFPCGSVSLRNLCVREYHFPGESLSVYTLVTVQPLSRVCWRLCLLSPAHKPCYRKRSGHS